MKLEMIKMDNGKNFASVLRLLFFFGQGLTWHIRLMLIHQSSHDRSAAHVPVTNYRNVWNRNVNPWRTGVTHCSLGWPSIHMAVCKDTLLNISRYLTKNSRVIMAAWNINFNVIIYFSISVQRISALVIRSFLHNQTFIKTAEEKRKTEECLSKQLTSFLLADWGSVAVWSQIRLQESRSNTPKVQSH